MAVQTPSILIVDDREIAIRSVSDALQAADSPAGIPPALEVVDCG